jgi:tetratricopeptide (TPR) repeat protein
MRVVKFSLIIFGIISLLGGCASVSEKQFKLAEQSMEKGDYAQAFDQGAQSLQAEIGNHKAIALFPGIAENAYAQKLAEIEQHKAASDWDRAAYGYDRVISMNQTIRQIQDALSVYGQKATVSKSNRKAMNLLLDIRSRDVAVLRDEVYEKAAAAHYSSGKRYVLSQDYRVASSEFNKALSFINPYKDAQVLAVDTRHLADLADAKTYYEQGVQAVQNHEHRTASIAFARAEEFIPGFKDAHALAAKYKGMADLQDALARYREGERLADNHQYRAAASAFNASLSFVPGYRDAYELVAHYTGLANRQDARRHYEQAMQFMDRQDFERAAREFEKADQFVPGFRDAITMAERARYFIPPNSFRLRHLVQESVQHGIPLSWLHDVHQGYTEEVKITSVRVIRQGRFNERREFWPYKLQVRGSCELEISKDNEQKVSFDTVVPYRVFRDDFGDWKARFRHYEVVKWTPQMGQLFKVD